ncbi:MAG: SgcJ/EcaC family oxidoreductase [Planctomycetales bacterium]|nr:SgcJ/EcaC family oxidoreductase [Planctomycetales bacterium]
MGIPSIVRGRVLWTIGLSIACSGACFAQDGAQPPAAPQAESPGDDVAAIRDQGQAFVAAFNSQDAKAVAALWTEGGEYVDDSGQRFVGRDAIEQTYAELFANGDVGQMRIMVDSIQMLSPDAAIEDGRAVLDPAPAGAPGYSKYTAVHVKRDGKWLMASVRDSWLKTASTHDKVADLEWLIGTWSAEDRGVTTKSVCRWVANKSFVERQYTTTAPDGTQTSGVQFIGWNPAEQYVQSWNFSPDGGHAVGVWTPLADGWSAEMHGVAGDGATTNSVNLLRRLDDDAYVWQSVGRTYDGQTAPDTDEVVVRRQPSDR